MKSSEKNKLIMNLRQFKDNLEETYTKKLKAQIDSNSSFSTQQKIDTMSIIQKVYESHDDSSESSLVWSFLNIAQTLSVQYITEWVHGETKQVVQGIQNWIQLQDQPLSETDSIKSQRHELKINLETLRAIKKRLMEDLASID